MDNEGLLIVIKDMFEKKTDELKDMFKTAVKEVKSEVAEVKNHMGVLVEKLEGDIKAVAEGHSILNNKIDKIQEDLNETKQVVRKLQSDMTVVKDYVIGVDAKLNEHEIILN